MITIVMLLVWITVLALAAWGTGRWQVFSRKVVPLSAGLVLCISEFWRNVALSLWVDGSTALLPPAAAFVSVWVLVLVPLFQRRLDRCSIALSLLSGLLAMAVIGTAIDMGNLFYDRWAVTAVPLTLVVVVAMPVLFFAGFALCLLVITHRFPWEYPAWFAGFLILTSTAHPVLSQFRLAAGHGIGTVAVTFVVSYSLYWGLKRYSASCDGKPGD